MDNPGAAKHTLIADAVVRLAEALDMQTVAKGIESSHEWSLLAMWAVGSGKATSSQNRRRWRRWLTCDDDLFENRHR